MKISRPKGLRRAENGLKQRYNKKFTYDIGPCARRGKFCDYLHLDIDKASVC